MASLGYEFIGISDGINTLKEQLLMISDPKALHHIFQATGYRYPRVQMRRLLAEVATGKGVTSVEGDDHRRQRRIMQPSFGIAECRELVPIFFACANKMLMKWTELIEASLEQPLLLLDLPEWVSRATLDAVGLAAFDYEFGALDDSDNELSRAYSNLFTEVFGQPSKGAMLTMSLFKYLPEWLIRFLFKKMRSPRLQRFRHLNEISRATVKTLMEEKYASLANGSSKKDVMSQIVRANISENPKSRLDESEMYSLMQIIIIGGHETTSNSIGWAVLELARHMDVQAKLREEIHATEKRIKQRGGTEFTMQDLESMPYLNAVVKEILRLHPSAAFVQRVAGSDDVLPLSRSIISETGENLPEVLIPKGTTIFASIAAYNRTVEIFGQDAHCFNPNRWIDGEPNTGTSIGVYANLFTFAGGNKSCIGWRFAVLEIQCFVVSIFSSFELSLAVPYEKIRRNACEVMIPVVEGEVEKGVQLPVRVKIANRE